MIFTVCIVNYVFNYHSNCFFNNFNIVYYFMFPYLNTEEVIIEVKAENCRVDIANLVALLELVGLSIIFFFI